MSQNSLTSLTVSQLKRAVAIKQQIARLERQLGALLGTDGASPAGKTRRGRRKMSPEARARIAAAARARWARQRAARKS
jgi:hypothetical protein